MQSLEPSRSAPNSSTAPEAAPLSRTRSATAKHPRLARVFSAQHLDDASIYHGGDHESRYHDGDIETRICDELEKTDLEAQNDIHFHGESSNEKTRTGVSEPQDLEANLQRKPTNQSVKDSNLVGSQDAKKAWKLWLTWPRSPGMALTIQRIQKTGLWEGSGLPLS